MGNTIKEFVSMEDASKELGVISGAISRVCSGEYSHTHGLHFKFKV